jgi:hypothetical protein
MGGIGSGIWYRSGKKTTTEKVPRLDIRELRKHELSGWADHAGKSAESRDELVFRYRRRSRDGHWRDVVDTVLLDRTPWNYGGARLWFLCPRCAKRVAVLYGASARFLCRQCSNLTYSSANESYEDRMRRKARKIRRRLGASNDLLQPILEKPKGMHWKTFERLVEAEREANEAAVLAMADSAIFRRIMALEEI